MKTIVIAFFFVLVPFFSMATSDTINVSMITDIPFSFEVGGKTLPAGSYRIVENADQHSLIIQNRTTNKSVFSGYKTRLAMRPADEGLVVFDVAGSRQYLSEVYIPGIDGFLIQNAPEPHTHLVIKAPNK